MEIRNLITFLQVTETKNFSRAAENLGYSQSAVTVQIQQLEQEIGRKLFDRIGKNISMTQYGQEFVPYAQEVVTAAKKAWNFAKTERELEGKIRVGFMESIMYAVFPDVIREYHKRFPGVRITLQIESEDLLVDMIYKNELDLIYVVGRRRNEPELLKTRETEDRIVLIANPTHPLAKKKAIPLSEIVKQELILMRRDNSYRIQFDEKLAEQGLVAKPFLELQSTALTINLVKQNHYITVLPQFAVREELKGREVVILDVEDCQLYQWSHVIYHKNKAVTPQLAGMLEEIEKYCYKG